MLLTRTTDQLGRSRAQLTRFVVIDTIEHDVVLGLPWLQAANPQIDWRSGNWRFPIQHDEISVGATRKQIRRARAAIIANIMPLTMGSTNTDRAPDAKRIPSEYDDFHDVFYPSEEKALPPHSTLEHRIDLVDDARPPWGPIYPLSESELQTLRTYLKDSEAKGWIRPSTSPAGAPILFVPKKGGKLRLCVDYRALNQLTRKDRTPLPLMSEILDRLQGARIFTKLDLKDAYHRIRIRAGDEWKTAFRTRYGHYEYLVMPFGLVNAPATFQAYINRALAGLVDLICIVYLDDILIYSTDPAEHTLHVRSVLERLRQWNLYVNEEKCIFHTTSVTFLGFIVSTEGIKMEPERVAAVAQWPLPSSVHDIQVFLGFTGFYRRFIKNYAKITKPLTDLLRGGRKGRIQLPSEALAAFQQLLYSFQHNLILKHFNPDLPIQVETDASTSAIGAVLTQLDDGKWRPLAFRSRKLNQTEERYDTADLELLAIIDAFRAWRHYLLYSCHTITVLTDHFNLQYFQTKKKPNARQLRWSDELAAFDFVIKFRPGAKNPADGLSRRPDHVSTTTYNPPNNLTQLLQDRLGRTSTSNDAPTLRQLIAATTHATLEQRASSDDALTDISIPHIIAAQQIDPFVTQSRWKTKRKSSVNAAAWQITSDGLLRYKDRIYIPPTGNLRLSLLYTHHDTPTVGHPGVTRTKKLLSRSYYWDDLPRQVRHYVSTCVSCQKTKTRRHRPYGALGALPLPTRPFGEISVDFITGLPASIDPRTSKSCNAILVVVDRFTKYAIYIATTTHLTARGFAALFFHHIVRQFGLPEGIVSDRGSLFTSHFWEGLCSLLDIKKRMSTAYHPQTDGQTERQNQNLEHYLRVYCANDQADWAQRLTLAEFAYNNAWHSATRTTPSRLLMGFYPKGINDTPTKPSQSRAPAATQHLLNLQQDQGRISGLLQQANAAYAKWYNRGRRQMHFNEGDWVLLSARYTKQQRPSAKLADKYLGPFKISKVVGESKLAYQLELPHTYRTHNTFPISALEPYNRRSDAADTTTQDIIVASEPHYEVEKILAHRGPKRNRQYLIRWQGESSAEDTWEPRHHIDDGPLLREYDANIERSRRRRVHATPEQREQDNF